MNLLLIFFIFSLEISVIICEPRCEDFLTCSSCVFSTFVDCEWCSDDNHKGKRCHSKKQVNGTWCQQRVTKFESNVDYTKNHDFSTGGNDGKIVQIKPQKVRITSASPGTLLNISIKYKPAKDAPLDIYFLIDNSKNINEVQRNLKEQATNIFELIKQYTNNVRLGIGTFVDKPVLPYANPEIQNVYIYKNHLSLTNNTDIFKEEIENIRNATNYDMPEDILDALMQTMLCENKVGWRKDGRRIIVTFSNAFYHAAGDGKILGAFDRYNMKCDENDALGTTMDYPSINQVNKVAKDNGYVIIFAYDFVRGDSVVEDYYKKLSEKIYGSKYIRMNNAKIAKMIKDEYIKIIGDVTLRSESSSDVQVIIKKNCLICKALHSNELEFVATVKVVSCPNPPKKKEIIRITPMSLNEELQIEIEFKCQCDCEKSNVTESNSIKCNREGDYQCGICKCKPDRSGDDCKCKSDSVHSDDDNSYKKCRKNTDDALLCSGHGECSCGKCESCHEGFFGPFCEYDENACPRPGGKLCSGHGKCRMGKCECDPYWDHLPGGIEDCGCTLRQESCIAPHSYKVCSGNGECNCGKCTCNKVNSNDTCSGRYCDKCTSFAAKRCEELEDYAYCSYLNVTNCQDMYNMTKNSVSVVFANRTEINSPNNSAWYMENSCRAQKGDDDSIFVFKYYYASVETDVEAGTEETQLVLVIQKELDEKPPANIWIPIGSAIGGILLIGLLILIPWKILTDLYDKREYERFVEQALAAGYNVNMTENPWYEPPTTTFINPAHVNSLCN